MTLIEDDIYTIQCELGAVKRCQQCRALRLVSDYPGFGEPTCDLCLEPELYSACRCGYVKPRGTPLCYWCWRKGRAA
jgi:hypothetical protein